jgi:chromate transporter
MPSNKHIFLVFLKIGALAFGGVYSMLAFFERELVDRRGWLDHDGFAEAVSIGQMTPGPPIVNTGVFIGYSLRGMGGALAATAGLVIPGFIIVIGLGLIYIGYGGVPVVGAVLKGVAAGVVGLLLSVVLRLFRGVIRSKLDMAVAAAAFALLVLAKANPIALIIGFGVFGYVVYGRRGAARA